MDVNPSKLTLIKTLLMGIKGRGMLVKGVLDPFVIIRTHLKCHTFQQNLMMIKIDLAYNVILKRPFL
jgi:hypothetical protein